MPRYSGFMNHALILNALIVVCVLVALAITYNPVCLLGLLLLKEMPYGLLTMPDEQVDEQGNPIGFVHHD